MVNINVLKSLKPEFTHGMMESQLGFTLALCLKKLHHGECGSDGDVVAFKPRHIEDADGVEDVERVVGS